MALSNLQNSLESQYRRFMANKPTIANNDKIRYIRVEFVKPDNNLIYDNDNFSIEFKLEIDRTSQSNVLELNIFNIKYEAEGRSTIEYDFLKLHPQMYVYAGYKEDLQIDPEWDLVYSGQLVSVRPAYNELDIAFQMVGVQEQEIWVNQILNVDFPKGKKPSEIIKEVIQKVGSYTDENWNSFNLGIGKIAIEGEGGRDIPYKSGFSKSNTTLQKILEEIAKDTYCIYYIENGLLYFIPGVQFIDETNYIEFKKILSLSVDDDGYNIVTGFKNYRVNTLVEIENIEKKFVIDKITHNCSGDGDAFETTIHILDMDIYGQNYLKALEKEKKKSEEDINKRSEKEEEKKKKNEERTRRK